MAAVEAVVVVVAVAVSVTAAVAVTAAVIEAMAVAVAVAVVAVVVVIVVASVAVVGYSGNGDNGKVVAIELVVCSIGRYDVTNKNSGISMIIRSKSNQGEDNGQE